MFFRAENKRLVTLVAAGIRVDDEALFRELQTAQGNEKRATEDGEFRRKCLTGPFPKSAKHLIERDLEKSMQERTLPPTEDSSIIFEAENEDVIIEIMRTYNKESWKIRSVAEGSNENLLHFFISRKFEKALSEFFALVKEDVRELCLQKNAANKIPLMTILTQTMDHSALELWRFMENASGEVDNVPNEELENALSMTDNSKDNIFHMCSSNEQTNTLLAICNSSKVSKKCIQDGLIQQNSNGCTAFDLCKDQTTLSNLLSSFDHTTHKLTSTDNEGKNILHHIARKDFSGAMAQLFKKLPSVEMRDMILQESFSNGSNVLMTAATYGSRETLELLLHFVSVFEAFSADDERIDMGKILHHRNMYGNTLLSLILQHKDALQVPKIILLGMESAFHVRAGQGDDLTCCFHQHLKPSGDVLRKGCK